MEEEYWTTKDGRKIAVGDMTEEHLKNTLRMILRKRREEEFGYDDMHDLMPCGGIEWWKD